MTTQTISTLNGLQPESVWKHFAILCSIPRQSKHEEKVRTHLLDWAQGIGLDALVTDGGNLLIRKPASPGKENARGVILQAHLDMVCQKNESVQHDFQKDPIQPKVVGNRVLAEHTTLGADDGIGVALALAILEDKSLVHGPLEVLLTVDEEEGMGGANKLPAGLLKGSLLLNLDSETWGDFCLGCAGGMDVQVEMPCLPEEKPAGWIDIRIDIRNLRGGHSGIDINEGRGNAIKILARILYRLRFRLGIRIHSMTGGSARNALPREASAIVAIKPGNIKALEEELNLWQTQIRRELAGVDDKLTVSYSLIAESIDTVMMIDNENEWIKTLVAAPHGVKRMNPSVPGTPETSINLGTVNLNPTMSSCTFMPRSTISTAAVAVCDELHALFALSGMLTNVSNSYPAWEPDLDSPLLATCRKVYRKEFDEEPATHIIHAGLECGILKSKYPVLDMISFGPTILSPHAPGEAVEIDTVEKCWKFLKAVLKELD